MSILTDRKLVRSYLHKRKSTLNMLMYIKYHQEGQDESTLELRPTVVVDDVTCVDLAQHTKHCPEKLMGIIK